MSSTRSSECRAFLLEVFVRQASFSARSWLESMLNATSRSTGNDDFRKIYARAARMLGAVPICLDDDESANLSEGELPLIDGRPLHELGRMILLLKTMEALAFEMRPEFIDDLYARGDLAERQALLRTLSLLPNPAGVLSTAVEACRSNVPTVFEAIACDNPYPLRYFPESSFNQMVMKAIFIGVPLRRIVGLPGRVTVGLVRMVRDYVQEQVASGRPIHHDTSIHANKG